MNECSFPREGFIKNVKYSFNIAFLHLKIKKIFRNYQILFLLGCKFITNSPLR